MPSLQLENSIVDERYEVRRRLNHGSYAEIYEAFDLAAGRRHVILKALNTSLQGTPDADLERTLVENFQNEAIALDAVSHPNVVRRLGHGTAADLAGTPFHYLVLEYMDGGDLMARCRRRPLELDELLGVVKQICEALDAAHERGVIHRDVKPNNLLLGEGGVVKIADFGVAKMTGDGVDDEVTRVGTDLYAPPEHNPNAEHSGVRERLTPSADVYSLAKTIYAAVTGRAPREYARRQISDLPRELLATPWGPRLLEILRRATADRVADRYASIDAFWRDFSELGQLAEEPDEPTKVRPREALAAPVPQAPTAPSPRFQPQLASGAQPRIIVDIATKAPPEPPPAPAPVAKKPPSPPPADQYSYREDLKDLVGSGWRLRAAILAVILLLCASVAAVYFEVHRYVSDRSVARAGTVTASQLNLRDSPAGREIGRLPYGTRVQVLDESDGWLEIQVTALGGPVESEQPDRGWVGSRHIALDQ